MGRRGHGLAHAHDLRSDRRVPRAGVAALNGHALGGGAEVAVAADIRVAADDIKIGFNQVSLEIMPAWGGAERLAALVGVSQALLLAGTGTILSARRRSASDLLIWWCRARCSGTPGAAWRDAGAPRGGRDKTSNREARPPKR